MNGQMKKLPKLYDFSINEINTLTILGIIEKVIENHKHIPH